MGFNIGRFLKSIAAPVIGGLIGGPAGAVVGAGITAGFGAETAAAATVGRATQPGPISAPTQRVFTGAIGGGATSIGPSFASLARLPSAVRDIGIGLGISTVLPIFNGGNGGGNPISVILAKARAATGGPVTRNKIIEAAKACGLEVAANTFGLDVREICLVVVKGRTRRRRGVSAADIRRTKRTIGFASKIRKDLKALAK